ncbi:MAG: PEP-utilizing enzyme [bacterium]
MRAAAPDDSLVGLTTVAEARRSPGEGWLAEHGALPRRDRPHAAALAETAGALFAAILNNIEGFAPGEAQRRRARGVAAAEALEARVRARLAAEADLAETEAMIERLRVFGGFREYPKLGLVRRFALYKQALLAEADRWVAVGRLARREDAFLLTFAELEAVAGGQPVDAALVARREAAHRVHQRLRAPRVLTSEGEALDVGDDEGPDPPAGVALAGLGVSVGVVEGRARVALDAASVRLAPGDILVTAGTDPGWTPHLLTAAGLVTEVGGLMTHGAVIARELGLPAVVGVVGATRRIREGQRVRVDGGSGAVVVLPDPPAG